MNSSSGGGRAFAVNKSSVTHNQRQFKYSPLCYQHTHTHTSRLFTFSTLLFTFLLFLLPLVQHRCSLCCLLQLGHEVLDVVKTVVEDALRKGKNMFCQSQKWSHGVKKMKVMKRRTTSLSARRKAMSGPPLTTLTAAEEKSGGFFSGSMFIHGPAVCIWNSSPPFPPAVPLPHAQTLTKQSLFSWSFHLSCVGLLFFPTSQLPLLSHLSTLLPDKELNYQSVELVWNWVFFTYLWGLGKVEGWMVVGWEHVRRGDSGFRRGRSCLLHFEVAYREE